MGHKAGSEQCDLWAGTTPCSRCEPPHPLEHWAQGERKRKGRGRRRKRRGRERKRMVTTDEDCIGESGSELVGFNSLA